MKNWKLATTNFLIGYAIASVVGYVLYLISITFMWIGMFTIMPLVFTYLSYLYFRKLIGDVRVKEAHKLALYWIGLSFLLDGAIYITLLPASFGVKPNWTFFLDQSPWIWVAYASIILITLAGFWFYRRDESRDMRPKRSFQPRTHMTNHRSPKLWRINTQLAVATAVVLAFVFAAMRGIGVQGPTQLRFFLPLSFTLMTALPWVLMTKAGRFEIGFKRPLSASWLVKAATFGALASLICFVIGTSLFGHGINNWYISVANNFAQTVPEAPKIQLYLMFTITAMIFSPLGEEMFFRGLLQKALEERFTTQTSTWIECAAFGLVHLFHHGLIIGALGFHFLPKSAFLWFCLMTTVAYLFAWLRKGGGSLYLAMISHSAFNFMMGTCIFLALWPPSAAL